MRYAVPRLLAALFLAGVGVVPVAGPADASVCSSTSNGVTVVVDFHELGGGVQTVCDPNGGGKTAAELFPDNGFPLDYVQRQPGFVCRVSGKPADDPCVNTPPSDAYWGLFWSNGTNGQWSYASSGAGSQKIPAGGSVAFSWQGSSSRSEPGVAPPQHSSQPSSQPSPSPTSKPSAGGGGGTGGGTGGTGGSGATSSASPGTSPTGSATPGEKRSRHHDGKQQGSRHHQKPTASPTPDSSATPLAAGPGAPATGADAVNDTSQDDGGLPGWVPITAIAALFALAVGVGVVQRRRS